MFVARAKAGCGSIYRKSADVRIPSGQGVIVKLVCTT